MSADIRHQAPYGPIFPQAIGADASDFLRLDVRHLHADPAGAGDPIEVRRGERGISPERHAELCHEMGLDQPMWKQFVDYVWGLLHGDFGVSIITKSSGCCTNS